MRVLSLSIMLAVYALFGAVAVSHAHTLSATECKAVAHDAFVATAERDVGVTFKMQIEQLASGLLACRDHMPVQCAYKDDQDDQRASTTIGWIYGNAEAAKMTPKQVRDRVESNCVAENEHVMESLRQSHGAQ